MANREIQTKLGIRVVVSGTTIVDTADFEALTYALQVENGTSVAFAESDASDLSDSNVVASQFIIGPVAFTAAGSALIGYVGKKRYVQVTVTTPVANSSIFAIEGQRDRNGAFTDVDKTT